MPTVPFEQSLKDMADESPEFAHGMLEAALNAILSGDLDEGRIHMKDYVRSTIGFQELANRTGKIDKNLMRTLGPKGNPTMANLVEIIQACIRDEDISIAAHVVPSREMEPARP